MKHDTCGCGARKRRESVSCRACWRETRARERNSGQYAPMEMHAYWNGGRRIDADGYVRLYVPEIAVARGQKSNRVLEHIVVMEKHLGRRLRRDEVVHHRDRDRKNNALDNLQLMERGEHSHLHASVQVFARATSGRFTRKAAA